MEQELAKTYEPKEFEARIYQKWEAAGIFSPIDDPKAKPFCVINPPTNANGLLHIGHVVGIALQDLMVRYHRMKGDATLWLPGFDHAGFETQVVYEKKLEKEGRSRFSIPREQLYEEMYDFSRSKIEAMKTQLQKLGASLDWSRYKFTLDPAVVKIVYQTFKSLYDDGLVYRGERPINWCPKHQTGLADLETKFEERVDSFYYLKYGPFTIGTARPETKFGDKYVVVHPADPRYKDFSHGQKIELEWINGPITATVLKDEAVDMKFGSGAMTITPWHDPLDFDIAKRHNLEMAQIIDLTGKLMPMAGEFAGQHISKARQAIVAKLKQKGLVEKVDTNYAHNVQVCYKCQTTIEPQVRQQWFIAMTKTGKSGKNLRDDAVAAVKAGEVRFVSAKHANLFYSWLRDLRDWNISHQIVWGIQLPIWYCKGKLEARNTNIETNSKIKNSKLVSDLEIRNSDFSECPPIVTDGSVPTECPNCGGNNLVRDPDVFNTWFSSGQWPFAALLTQNNPKPATSDQRPATSDYDRFYPTSVMETGYDIIFFWVARMIMLGLYATDQVPFRHIYLHGLVRDQDRVKMSKSKGNVIDPLGIAEQYGVDAVRLALVFGTSAGNDIIISEDKIRGMRNFANKLWNIARFTTMNLKSTPMGPLWGNQSLEMDKLTAVTEADKKIVAALDTIKIEVTANIERWQFHLAAEKLYDFIWHELADTYLEAAKGQLEDPTTSASTQRLLLVVLTDSLILLHPFMPFVTEAIYQSLPKAGQPPLLAAAPWPGIKINKG